ncbi:hypothetical protein COT42_03580 [Candidatus Saganbacteria bacterium CG08_land_8_20_14_0_20_45_16]|uniref:Uncharacterized protein n=1 Tax=Candidatus Saganbacteria bacterium CG08_land_8_20_14_0_20_45_16 TaxID=2014293 RepID=A0A2H0Y107_UNCSA|nr:MAG: hypothetical protein COT42_03580 [Candidatus Saganbacteria bacterium CG08_land_8_20_14_0_20_45_16]
MKIVFIVFNAAIEDEVMECLAKTGVSNYTKFPDIHGKGGHSDPHLDTQIWPGTNHGLLIAADVSLKDKILKEVKNLKAEYAKEGIKAFVFSPEEVA